MQEQNAQYVIRCEWYENELIREALVQSGAFVAMASGVGRTDGGDMGLVWIRCQKAAWMV